MVDPRLYLITGSTIVNVKATGVMSDDLVTG